MSDPLNGMLSGLAREGWDAFDGLDERQQDEQKRVVAANQEQAEIVRKALGTPEGANFISWLAQLTVLRPPSQEENASVTIEDYALRKARREGQNQIFYSIMAALHYGAGTKAPQGPQPPPGGQL